MFDKVMFLAEGRMVYYGPRETAISYFASLGYPCPKYCNPADFFILTLACPFEDMEKRKEIEKLGNHWKDDQKQASWGLVRTATSLHAVHRGSCPRDGWSLGRA